MCIERGACINPSADDTWADPCIRWSSLLVCKLSLDVDINLHPRLVETRNPILRLDQQTPLSYWWQTYIILCNESGLWSFNYLDILQQRSACIWEYCIIMIWNTWFEWVEWPRDTWLECFCWWEMKQLKYFVLKMYTFQKS